VSQVREPESLGAELKFSPRAIFGVPVAVSVFLHVMTGGDIQVGGNLILATAGGILASIGLVLVAWATIALRKGGQHPDPARATTALVTDGPFQYTRNPIYLSFTSLSLGVALLLNSYWVLGSLPISVLGLQILVIPREERYMENVIGHQFNAYCESVRRWL